MGFADFGDVGFEPPGKHDKHCKDSTQQLVRSYKVTNMSMTHLLPNLPTSPGTAAHATFYQKQTIWWNSGIAVGQQTRFSDGENDISENR